MDIEYDSMTDLEKAVDYTCPHCDSTHVERTGELDITPSEIRIEFVCDTCGKTWEVAYDLVPTELILG